MMNTKDNNSPIKPIKIPSISKLYADTNNFLSTRKSCATINLESSQWQIELTLCSNSVKPCILSVSYTIKDTELVFNIPKDFLQKIIPPEFNIDAIIKLPIDLKSAVIVSSLQPLINNLKSILGVNITFNKISKLETIIDNENLSINISSDNFQSDLYINLSDNLINLIKLLPKSTTKNDLNIPYFISFEVGSSRLTKSEIIELETEDIIFIQRYPQKNQYFIRINKYTVFIGEISNNSLTIKSMVKQMNANLDNNESTNDEHNEINDNDIELDVVFEIAQQQINISELNRIAVGHIFDLNTPIDSPVKIIVNGKYVADSELVEVDNRLGARITKLY